MEFTETKIDPERDGTDANQLYLRFRDLSPSNTFSIPFSFLLSRIKTKKGKFSLFLEIGREPQLQSIQEMLDRYRHSSTDEPMDETSKNQDGQQPVFDGENAYIKIMCEEGDMIPMVFSDYLDAVEFVEKYLESGI